MLRRATPQDCQYLFELRRHPSVMAIFPNKNPFDYPSHCEWFDLLIKDPERVQWVAEVDGRVVGAIRADKRKCWPATRHIENSCEFSYIVSPEDRGKGYGTEMVRQAAVAVQVCWPHLEWVVNTIRMDNAASIKAMEKTGQRLLYKVSDEEGVWAWQVR